MTQRQMERLPDSMACGNGHIARLMLDVRRATSGGGHFVQCPCATTQKRAEAAEAVADWRRMHGIRKPRETRQQTTNVVQLGLRLKGGDCV